jgi:hypothetical protein
MAKKRKPAKLDLAAEDILMAEEDIAAMRPALAVAPELVLQTIAAAKRKRRRAKPAKKKAKSRKTAAAKRRKASPKRNKKARRK